MITSGAHRYPVRVYYDDTDAGGIVYHATYLRMAERARTEALRELGASHADLVAEHGLAFVVRHAELDYFAPARLDDLLCVVTRPVALGSASVRLLQSFFACGDDDPATIDETATRPLVVARVSLVCVGRPDNAEALRPARIPERWRAALGGLADQDGA